MSLVETKNKESEKYCSTWSWKAGVGQQWSQILLSLSLDQSLAFILEYLVHRNVHSRWAILWFDFFLCCLNLAMHEGMEANQDYTTWRFFGTKNRSWGTEWPKVQSNCTQIQIVGLFCNSRLLEKSILSRKNHFSEHRWLFSEKTS